MRRHLRAPHAPVHRSTEDRGAQALFIITCAVWSLAMAALILIAFGAPWTGHA